MKITDIDLFYLALPEIADISDGTQDTLLVRVGTDRGIEGFGECDASPLVSMAAYCCPSSHSNIVNIRDLVIGETLETPDDIRRIQANVWRRGLDIEQIHHAYAGTDIALWDALGLCFFVVNRSNPEGIKPREMARLYSLATGIRLSESDLMKIGERLHNMEKIFNIVHGGFTREHDYPPQRFMEEPVSSGPLKGELLGKSDWDHMLDEYYTLRGWNSEGIPGEEKLKELGIADYAM